MKALKLMLLVSILFIFASCEKEHIEHTTPTEIIQKDLDGSGHICIYQSRRPKANAVKRHRTFAEDFLYFIPVDAEGCFNVYIIDGCPDMYIQATLNAIDAYNAIPNTRLELTIVDNLADADIRVACNDFGHGDCGGAGSAYPADPIWVFLNTAIATTSCFPCEEVADIDLCHMQFTAMHEIGHALGIDHTDNTSAPLINGTPVSDFYSVFNSGSMPNAFCAGLCEFTAADINAIQTLYPPCGGFLSGNSGTYGYQTYPLEEFGIPCSDESQTISVSVQALDVPNRFRILEAGGGALASSQWLGWTNNPGPWGASLNGPSSATLTFESSGGLYFLEVETVVQGQTDAWEAGITCN